MANTKQGLRTNELRIVVSVSLCVLSYQSVRALLRRRLEVGVGTSEWFGHLRVGERGKEMDAWLRGGSWLVQPTKVRESCCGLQLCRFRCFPHRFRMLFRGVRGI